MFNKNQFGERLRILRKRANENQGDLAAILDVTITQISDMASNRIGRINEEIQRELASLIPNVKDPRVTGMISVTAVETTPDLRYAKVYISVLDKGDCAQVLKGLRSASGYLRRELGRALQLRYTPELSFVQDDSIVKGAHILELLRDPEVVKPVNPDNPYQEDKGI